MKLIQEIIKNKWKLVDGRMRGVGWVERGTKGSIGFKFEIYEEYNYNENNSQLKPR